MCDNYQELNEKLENLILEAREYPPRSPQRIRTFTILIRNIEQSGGLSHRPCSQEVYDEAMQRLRIWLYNNLEKYDPCRITEGRRTTVISWIRNKLNFIILDILDEQRQRNEPLPSERCNPEETPFLSEQVIEIIRQDPHSEPEGGIFSSTRIKCRSSNFKASWKYIALRINIEKGTLITLENELVEKASFTKLAEELNIRSVSTVSTFYWNKLQEFVPIIKKYLREWYGV